MLVQVSRAVEKAHEHIPNSILLIPVRVSIQIVDCNKWCFGECACFLSTSKERALVAKSNPCESRPDFLRNAVSTTINASRAADSNSDL